MDLLLKYNRYLKQVYPTETLLTLDKDSKISFTITKDKQIKQAFTGGEKNNIRNNNDEHKIIYTGEP
jgi:hypothetical protein